MSASADRNGPLGTVDLREYAMFERGPSLIFDRHLSPVRFNGEPYATPRMGYRVHHDRITAVVLN